MTCSRTCVAAHPTRYTSNQSCSPVLLPKALEECDIGSILCTAGRPLELDEVIEPDDADGDLVHLMRDRSFHELCRRDWWRDEDIDLSQGIPRIRICNRDQVPLVTQLLTEGVICEVRELEGQATLKAKCDEQVVYLLQGIGGGWNDKIDRTT